MLQSKTFKPNSNTYSFLFKLIDLMIILAALPLAAEFYGIWLTSEYVIAGLTVAVAFLYFAETLSFYRSWRHGSFSEMMLIGLASLVLSFFFLTAVAFVLKQSADLSRMTIGLWFAIASLGFLLWRRFALSIQRKLRKSGYNVKKSAIIGATESGERLFREIQANDELGYQFVGFYEDRDSSRVSEQLVPHIKGGFEQALSLVREGEIDTLFIALPLKADQQITDILVKIGDTTVDIHFIPDFFIVNLMHARIIHVGDIDTLTVFESPYYGAKEWLKRTEDLLLGCLILLLIAVPMLFIALGIKLTSKGPVFFKQRRYGLNGEEIRVWKFRSMVVMENDHKVVQATKNDARVTPFGGFLRRTSLDELPQFFNVLKGDMSIVGPRPHAVAHNEEYRGQVPFYMFRHKVKPGITGWAQINGWRGETDTLDKMKKRVEFDLHYLKDWSIWFDIKIIFLTIVKGFVNKNAF
ncbi:undecaprenyl-phosphate glucose phosphotransferase [Thalassomonas haliotis]|uniref:Undecaprenyl-phosphate glucose phosphotransferase n=1 Tax=Thalassomonas haliotis TaxID=485448 RepID=A0ABY7VIM1_9GAMM|nr:undecaprenyl-phosphate glucose phosphotransferase [Thalassomonas haliotis]WDE12788.1 undecaprenyl-phosphate glucose phosphotransferase [Thalassomonas haliotis]